MPRNNLPKEEYSTYRNRYQCNLGLFIDSPEAETFRGFVYIMTVFIPHGKVRNKKAPPFGGAVAYS